MTISGEIVKTLGYHRYHEMKKAAENREEWLQRQDIPLRDYDDDY